MSVSGSVNACADADPAAHATAQASSSRLQIDVFRPQGDSAELAADVQHGLSLPHKALPPKYFYDERGARLFDAICELPEYYLTRTEAALLQEIAAAIAERVRPADLVELGSGASRKTRILLDALTPRGELRYVPIDVSEKMLRESALALLRGYPDLRVHAVVGDYERDLHRLPASPRRLLIFLGSTAGNLTPAAMYAFLRRLREHLSPEDYFLLGLDLLKPVDVLEAAYNDTAGLTAEFNRNILHVLNRELQAEFAPESFAHIAFFNHQRSQIEMYLRTGAAQEVCIRRLDRTVRFAAGELLHTEISRKFTRTETEAALSAAGWRLTEWYTPDNGYFGLALARPR